MRRHLVALAALGLTFAALACGGGSGNVTYAPTVVSITHIDFKGMDFTYLDTISPPPVGRYPATVAEVNRTAVTGEALVAEEMRLELQRRQWTSGDLADQFPDELKQIKLQEISSTDPLEVIIDDELERQAVSRLGYLPNLDEAKDLARKDEQMSFQILDNATPEVRPTIEAALRVGGRLKHNWADDPQIVEQVRRSMGLTNLHKAECMREATATPIILGFINSFTTNGKDCTAFLAKERKSAKIVYYVRWAD